MIDNQTNSSINVTKSAATTTAQNIVEPKKVDKPDEVAISKDSPKVVPTALKQIPIEKEAIQQEASTKKITEDLREDMEQRLEEVGPAAGVAPVINDNNSKPIDDILSAPPYEQEKYINQG